MGVSVVLSKHRNRLGLDVDKHRQRIGKLSMAELRVAGGWGLFKVSAI